jgi:hypothetical protein
MADRGLPGNGGENHAGLQHNSIGWTNSKEKKI